MELTSSHLIWLFIGQLGFGAILVIAIATAVKERTLELITGENGPLVLKIITIFFICTVTGNLALMKILDAAATAALFGGVLGYVFGAALPARHNPGSVKDRTLPSRRDDPA